MIRYIAFLLLFLLATAGSIAMATSHGAFCLWDVGYYLTALGALLCAQRLAEARQRAFETRQVSRG